MCHEAGMSVSVLIPWSNRADVAVTLARNAPVFDAHDADVIVVNCGGQVDTLTAILGEVGSSRIRIVDCRSPVFNKCRAIKERRPRPVASSLFLMPMWCWTPPSQSPKGSPPASGLQHWRGFASWMLRRGKAFQAS